VLHRAILSMHSEFFRVTLGDSNRGVNGVLEKKGSKRKKTEDIHTGENSNIRYRLRISGKGQDAVLVLQVCSRLWLLRIIQDSHSAGCIKSG